MINHIEARLDKVSIHHIPQPESGSGVVYSENAFHFDDEAMKDALLKLFFSSFKEPEYYRFKDIDSNSNPVYDLVCAAFDEPEAVHAISCEIARNLFQQSRHPNIKPGDLIVAHVEDILIDDELLSAIVIIKSENKHSFLKIHNGHSGNTLSIDRGMPLNKLDKACIVFDTGREDGFKCCVLDTVKSGEDAIFWISEFLNVTKHNNDYQKTKAYIQVTKGFIDERMKPLYEVEKQDEAALLDLSKSYFNSTEDFEESSYLDSLFGDQEEIKSEFRHYREDVGQEAGLAEPSEFKVSQAAVKNQSRVFKSVIKLDKNFHIYVHGNRNMIQKGVDDEGRKYYILYYDAEQ